MSHPRLSVSEMCTYPWSFGDELDVWDELGVKYVGVITAKLDAFGRDKAVAALREHSMRATTIITGCFDLADPDSWPDTRAQIDQATDLAVEIGGVVYFTPGRRDGRSFGALTSSLAEAVEPCTRHAASQSVRLAIEPSLRTDVSYVHTLRDALDVARETGLDVIADLGNCWMERDYEDTIRRAGPQIACVQFADAIFGTPGQPPPGGRAVPGDGDLAIPRFLEAALDAGYTGPFELEMVGPKIEAEGHEPALRRAVERATEILDEVVR